MTTKLYVIPGSHPCVAIEVALRLKGIEYTRVDLIPMTQLLIGRFAYGASTVPGLRIDGERLAGSRAIMRRLDELAPEPPLLPADPEMRERVLEAERWGEEVLQDGARRVLDAGFLRDPAAMEGFVPNDARLPIPTALARPTLRPMAAMLARKSKTSDDSLRRDLGDLPGWLDNVDRLIGEHVLGGSSPNAADLQIGSSLWLLRSIEDLAPLMDGRPGMALIDLFPAQPGRIRAGTLAVDWVTAA